MTEEISKSSSMSIELRVKNEDQELRDVHKEDNYAFFRVEDDIYLFPETSLYLFSSSSKFRLAVIQIITNKLFEYLIITFIFLNMLLMCLLDYNFVDSEGDLVTEGSVINYTENVMNYFFIAIFTLEMTLKIIAMGFVAKRGAYLNEYWNWLDFVVVITGLISLDSDNNPELKIVRMIRIIRPVKLLFKFPAMRAIVIAMVNAIPSLFNVLSVIILFFTMISIIAREIFSGPYMHTRCRITPFPVNITWLPGDDPHLYRCIHAPNFNIPSEQPSWTKSMSPWNIKRDCIWPIDTTDLKFCDLDGTGYHRCRASQYFGTTDNRTCGSNFDALGNYRFTDVPALYETEILGYRQEETYIPTLYFGLINFDTVSLCFMFLFKILTCDSWSDHMVKLKDTKGDSSVVFFVFVQLFGSLGIMQLFLAVLDQKFHKYYDTMNNQKLQNDEDLTQDDKRITALDSVLEGNDDKTIEHETLPDDHIRIKNGLYSRFKKQRGFTNTLSIDQRSCASEQDQDSIKSECISYFEEMDTGKKLFARYKEEKRLNEKLNKSDNDQDSELGGSIHSLTDEIILHDSEIREGDCEVDSLNGLDIEAFYNVDKNNHNDEVHTESETDENESDIITVVVSAKRTGPDRIVQLQTYIIFVASSIAEIFNLDFFYGIYIKVFTPFFNFISQVVNNDTFESVSMVFVVLNTVILSMDQYPAPSYGDVTDNINFILVLYFGLELLLRIIGLGIVPYMSDFTNFFDAFVCIISLVEAYQLPPSLVTHYAVSDDDGSVAPQSGGGPSPSVLRSLKLFRIFRSLKIVSNVKSFRVMMGKLVKTINDVKWFLMLLVLVMIIFSVVGMQLFANRFRYDQDHKAIASIHSQQWFNAYEVAYQSFDTFPNAFCTVFQILSTDNWTNVMYNIWRADGIVTAAAYAYSLMIICNFLIMNSYFAILLGNFSSSLDENGNLHARELESVDARDDDLKLVELEKEAEERFVPGNNSSNNVIELSTPSQFKEITTDTRPEVAKDDDRDNNVDALPIPSQTSFENWDLSKLIPVQIDWSIFNFTMRDFSLGLKEDGLIYSQYKTNEHNKKALSRSEIRDNSSPSEAKDDSYNDLLKFNLELKELENDLKDAEDRSQEHNNEKPSDSCKQIDMLVADSIKTEVECILSQSEPEPEPEPEPVPLAQSCFSRTCSLIVENTYFVFFIYFLIIFSCIVLALGNPLLDPASPINVFVGIVDIVVAVFFTLEMVLKMGAYGFLGSNPHAYFNDAWGYLDLSIVVLGWVCIAPGASDLVSVFKVFRAFKSLRVLRLSSIVPGLKEVIDASIAIIPAVKNVSMVYFSTIFIFALIMLGSFKGQFRECSGIYIPPGQHINASSCLSMLYYPTKWSSISPIFRECFGPNSTYASAFNASTGCFANGTTQYPCCPNFSPTARNIDSITVCECWGGKWSLVIPETYDNIYRSVLTTFEISTLQNWGQIMYAATAARGIGLQPIQSYNPMWGFAFVIIAFFTSYFGLGLFLATVFDTYITTISNSKEQESEAQFGWRQIQKLSFRIKLLPAPFLEAKTIIDCLHNFVHHPIFRRFKGLLLVTSLMMLTLKHWGEDENFTAGVYSVQVACSFFFSVHSILNLITLQEFFIYDWYNILDLILVFILDVLIIADFWLSKKISFVPIILGRFLRLYELSNILAVEINFRESVRVAQSIILLIPGIWNVAIVLLIIIYMFAVIFNQLFATVGYGAGVPHSLL